MEPLVSVIIPTYQRAELLRKAMCSVWAQTYRHWELIVVENGRSQVGREIVQEFQRSDARLRYLYRREPGGLLARNMGIQEARGEYIAFLDNDDEWLATKLERQVSWLVSHERDGLVVCQALCVDGEGRVLDVVPHAGRRPTLRALVTNECGLFSLSGAVVRRGCFDRVGVFSTRYPIANDYDLYFRLAKAGYGIGLVEEPLFRYRLHSGNLTSDRSWMWRDLASVLRSLEPEPSQGVTHREIQEAIVRNARWCYTEAIESVDRRQYGRAARYYRAAVQCDPWIGAKVAWSRSSSKIYRVLRPYLAFGYCFMRSLARWGRSSSVEATAVCEVMKYSQLNRLSADQADVIERRDEAGVEKRT